MPSDEPPASPRWQDRLHGHTRRAFDEVRLTASSFRSSAFPPPPEDRWIQRLLFGLLLPFWLLRFWWSDRGRRRSYLRATLPSALVTLVVGVLLLGLEGSVRNRIQDDAQDARIARLEKRIERNQARIAHARSAEQREELEEGMAALQEDLAELKAEVAAQVARDLARKKSKDDDEASEVEDDADEASDEVELEQPEAPPPPPAKRAPGDSRTPKSSAEQPVPPAALKRGDDARSSNPKQGRVDWLPPLPPGPPMPWDPAAPSPSKSTHAAAEGVGAEPRSSETSAWVRLVAILSAVYGALRMVEWFLLAVTRDFQDQLSRKMSLATGTPPDDPEEKPRLRLNVRWLWHKFKRRVRGFLLIGMGLVLLSLVKLVPIVGHVAFSVAATLWTAYWLGVFALAKSRLAWEYGGTQPPWFARLTHPALAWWGPRIWGRVAARISRSIWSACASFERAPFEAVGLAISRLVLNLPVVYSLLRPVFPVAAQHVLVARPPNALALPSEIPPAQPTA